MEMGEGRWEVERGEVGGGRWVIQEREVRRGGANHFLILLLEGLQRLDRLLKVFVFHISSQSISQATSKWGGRGKGRKGEG